MTGLLDAAGLPSATGACSPSVQDDGLLKRNGHYQPHPEQPTIEGSATAANDQRRTVLVVDDEPTVRLLITEVLDDLNYMCLEAVDGPSSLEILRSDAPIALMITDVGLPGGIDGRLLASIARVERPGLAILFITGYAETDALGDSVLEAGTMVLTKPFSIDALTSHIMKLAP